MILAVYVETEKNKDEVIRVNQAKPTSSLYVNPHIRQLHCQATRRLL